MLVLTGAGKAFSAGGDIEHMQKVIDEPHLFLDGIRNGKKLLFGMLDCPKPIIAKVNGAAMGLGATIALFSDIIIAANHAKIADPHVKVGFVAGDGGAVIWPALLGHARAKQYLLTGDALTGEEAARIGLINQAVPAEELDRVVDEFAQRIANGASLAIQWTKLSVNVTAQAAARRRCIEASFAYEALSEPDGGPPGSRERVPREARAEVRRSIMNGAPIRGRASIGAPICSACCIRAASRSSAPPRAWARSASAC